MTTNQDEQGGASLPEPLALDQEMAGLSGSPELAVAALASARKHRHVRKRSRRERLTFLTREPWPLLGVLAVQAGPSLRLVCDLIAFCGERLPQWNPISISGYHIREAGATAPQELAFTFANALAYVRAARAAGLDPDRVGERLSFFFACHSDFVEEVAKFRCARRLWARLARERLGIQNPRAQQCRFHVQTGGVTLTAQQPDNNVVRVALQALAAVLGGCQSLHTNARDEALALPTEESARVALRTQQILASPAYEPPSAETT